jgi:hypothetical protein
MDQEADNEAYKIGTGYGAGIRALIYSYKPLTSSSASRLTSLPFTQFGMVSLVFRKVSETILVLGMAGLALSSLT